MNFFGNMTMGWGYWCWRSWRSPICRGAGQVRAGQILFIHSIVSFTNDVAVD